MARPEQRMVTLTVDGREVEAPENAMLVDGAKYADVEIPVFCYEPKLGQPVGACRMCLVEIEGMPKLQTACSTAVKDGMVVHTQTERVRTAQQAVVEFLLVNHPLDCPVCDKGGECPLQDISYGWGPGTSRFIEPKRHFRKPLELSPLVAIDRERCILCYRCVRFSQEISEDYQLVFTERGAHTYVGTFATSANFVFSRYRRHFAGKSRATQTPITGGGGRAFQFKHPYCRANRLNKNAPSTMKRTLGNQTSSSGCTFGFPRSVSPMITKRK